MIPPDEALRNGLPMDPYEFVPGHATNGLPLGEELWVSRKFIVHVTRIELDEALGFPSPVTELSVRRQDRRRIRDWRELQRIKNALCGPEREAMEMYPAESRLVDTANQYYLFVLPEGSYWPFGMRSREVLTQAEQMRMDAALGMPNVIARQHPFDDETEAASRTVEEMAEYIGHARAAFEARGLIGEKMENDR